MTNDRPHARGGSPGTPGLYGWLDLLRIAADTGGSVSLGDLIGDPLVPSLKAVARRLTEEYGDDSNPYDWQNEDMEIARIESALTDASSAQLVDLLRHLAALLADEAGVRAARAWRAILVGCRPIRTAPAGPDWSQHSLLSGIVGEFFSRQSHPAVRIEPDPWDDWFTREHPESDPGTLASELRLTVAGERFRAMLPSLPASDLAILRRCLEEAAAVQGVPSDLADQLGSDASDALDRSH